MRTLLDEILEVESPPTNRIKSSCGCGCPSCSGSGNGQWRNYETDALIDEILYESNADKIASAVAFNRKRADQVGWGPHRNAIVARILKLNYTPDESNFAVLVADWQFSNGLTPDGKLGTDTWARMRPALGLSSAPQPQATPVFPGGSFGGDDLKSCPVFNPGRATDRCLVPGAKSCPSIPNLLCMRGVNGIPFEYVHKKNRDGNTGLDRPTKTDVPRQQKFVPGTRDALIEFTRNMAKFGMPVKSIFTLGSLYCRCVSNTQTLSNHSYGEAIDVAGVRWKNPNSLSRVEDSLLTPKNLSDSQQRRLFQRMNACLRLSFPNVIDYHRSDHLDHFHCDLNRGGRNIPGAAISFAQEALGLVLRTSISVTGKMNAATYQALTTFSGLDNSALKNETTLKKVFQQLFERIASGKF